MTEENGLSFTSMQTFFQFGNTQVGLLCRAPSTSYRSCEELFVLISKQLRVLGVNSAPFARAGIIR